jgi:cytochrome P450
MYRVATADTQISDRKICKGQMITLMLGAGNRDQVQFAQPDQFDVTRADNRHLGFGFGIHFCVGAPLARLEGQIALDAILRRLPQIKLTGVDVEWREDITVRGLKRLPLIL